MDAGTDRTSAVDAEALARLTMDLIDIPSPMGSEAGVARFLAERFRAVGLETRLVDVEPDRPNVIGRLPGRGGGPTLLVVGHMDTTWGGDEEGIAGRGSAYLPKAERDGDWIYGMGAYNMKSGLATAVHVVETLAARGEALDGDLIIAGVCGETSHAQSDTYRGARYRGAGVGARFLVTNGVTADFAVIAEPTAGRIVNVTGGYLLFEVTTRGVPGATYLRGGKVAANITAAPDAISAALAITAGLQTWRTGYIERTPYAGQPATNVSVIGIEGGHGWRPSKVASYCRLYVEVDIMPGADQAGLEQEFRGVVAAISEAGSLESSVTMIQNVPGSRISPKDPFIGILETAHASAYGEAPEITFDAFHADTSALTRFGIPTVCYGPGGRMRGGGAAYYAREGEMCYLPDLVQGVSALTAFLRDAGNRPRADLTGPRPADGPETLVR